MVKKLTQLTISGLHNQSTVGIPVNDGTLILVGENGTGKSTVANIAYYLFTSQWKNLLEYTFKSISVEFEEHSFLFARDEIILLRRYGRILARLRRFLPDSIRDSTEKLLDFIASTDDKTLTSMLRLPSRAYRDLDLFQVDDSVNDSDDEFKSFKELLRRVNELQSVVGGQILFLPTYRRIEQELERVFPHLTEDEPRRRKFFRNQSTEGKYIELVEFGMEDVERLINRRMNEIKEKVRRELSGLTGEYLRDVIRRSYENVSPENFEELDESLFENIFLRIPAEILTETDKNALREVVSEIRASKEIQQSDIVVAHFLSQLLKLHVKQQEDEKDVREFVQLLNEGYLVGKQFVYDDANFEVSIVQTTTSGKGKTIAMQSLSSGEKQIVSLFSHLYLSKQRSYFVIIDEPELSLSVPWQRRFLPDILSKANGLIAVTHSPFIFDNDLQSNVKSMDEHVTDFEPDPNLQIIESLQEDDIPF